MVHTPEPGIEHVEAWENFCNTYGDIVYNVLLSGQTAIFRGDERFLYELALKKGNEILTKSFMSEKEFLKVLPKY